MTPDKFAKCLSGKKEKFKDNTPQKLDHTFKFHAQTQKLEQP